ncbi:MAG: hypothetical protein U1E10_19175 [Bdellovibrionales bacterium]|nr:hypothetical protein [Bdellovibrionales bacterium]
MDQHMNQIRPIRTKVLIASLSLLGPVLLVTHLITHSFSSSALASSSGGGCSEVEATVTATQSWMDLYQPLASRGGIYRKAYQEHSSRNESARKSLSACLNN